MRTVHVFTSTQEAYDASQTGYNATLLDSAYVSPIDPAYTEVADGDILVTDDHKSWGIMYEAWPVSIHGSVGCWHTFEDGRIPDGYEQAVADLYRTMSTIGFDPR